MFQLVFCQIFGPYLTDYLDFLKLTLRKGQLKDTVLNLFYRLLNKRYEVK